VATTLAQPQDLVLGQHGLVVIADVDQLQDRVPVVGHVPVGEDLHHALDLLGGRRVDLGEQRVVALGAVHLQMQQPGRVHVLHEDRLAGHVAHRVQALDGLADDVQSVVAHALIRSAASRMARMMLS
jgi:hypothetical protein